jgi:Fe-S cluster assembly protein SufD
MGTALLETESPTPSLEEPAAGLIVGPEHLRGNGNAAAWRAEARTSAWQRFESLPMPARTDELWRFSTLKALELGHWHAPQLVGEAVANELRERSVGLAKTAGRLAFANDVTILHDRISSELAAKGVVFLPIEEAATRHADLFERHFMREEAILGSRKFAALHESWVRNGTFLYVPRNVEIEQPLEAYHWLQGENGSCFPHTLIIADENSRVTLVDYFQSADATAPGFACGVNDLWLGAGAKVTYLNVQAWSPEVKAVQLNATVVGRDASAVALATHFGGAYVRSESVSHLRGTGGRSDMLALGIGESRRELDQRTLQIHEVPHTTSDLLYKNALDDQSRSTFSGLIRVAPGAHFTDAYQKVRNLLLSDEAEANSAPGLEIEADNVRCTHGATSGQVESEELFYLLSRGIPVKQAQHLIVRGFLQEVLDRLPDETLRAQITELLEPRFTFQKG